MRKLPPAILFLVIVTLPAMAQSSSYSIDNFDFNNAVRVYEPPPKVLPVTPKNRPGRVRTAKKDAAAPTASAPALSLSPLIQPTSLSTVTASDLSSLRGYTTGSSLVDG